MIILGLNYRLKLYNSSITVVAFIIMPAATNNYNVESLKGQATTKQVRDVVDEIVKKIGVKIYDKVIRGAIPKESDLMDENDLNRLKRQIFALKRENLPPIVTHNMVDGDSDLVLREVRRLQLFNTKEDRVKVIFHPEFLSPHNPVLGMEYGDFVRGCHLGVFPSYYEPW